MTTNGIEEAVEMCSLNDSFSIGKELYIQLFFYRKRVVYTTIRISVHYFYIIKII
jgi:hypothetical protein